MFILLNLLRKQNMISGFSWKETADLCDQCWTYWDLPFWFQSLLRCQCGAEALAAKSPWHTVFLLTWQLPQWNLSFQWNPEQPVHKRIVRTLLRKFASLLTSKLFADYTQVFLQSPKSDNLLLCRSCITLQERLAYKLSSDWSPILTPCLQNSERSE